MNKNIFFGLPTYKYLEKVPALSEEKNKVFTEIILTFLALSVFGFFAINPTLSTIAQLKKQMSDAEYVNSKLQQKITNLSLLSGKYEALNQDLSIVLSALPKKPTVPLLTGQVRSLASESNINLQKIQVFQVDLSGKSSFTFSIDGEGSYENIVKFLDAFVGFERVVTIDTLAITKGSKENQLPRLSLRAKAYFMQ